MQAARLSGKPHDAATRAPAWQCVMPNRFRSTWFACSMSWNSLDSCSAYVCPPTRNKPRRPRSWVSPKVYRPRRPHALPRASAATAAAMLCAHTDARYGSGWALRVWVRLGTPRMGTKRGSSRYRPDPLQAEIADGHTDGLNARTPAVGCRVGQHQQLSGERRIRHERVLK